MALDGVPPQLIAMIKAYYRSTTARVLISNSLSQHFGIRSDVGQSCILSPILFNYAIDQILGKALHEGDGLEFAPGHRLTDLDYADTIALLASSVGALQSMLSRINFREVDFAYLMFRILTRNYRSRQQQKWLMPPQVMNVLNNISRLCDRESFFKTTSWDSSLHLYCCPALNEIRTSGELNELVIEVKHGAILNAHRIILAARIPSLRAALSGALGKDNSVLKWPTVPLNLANSLLQYVYTGQLEVTQTNAMAIVMFAKMMKLSDLENWGVRFMANRVNLENLATIWDFAKSVRMESLMETCINLMQEQFRSFVSSDLFVRLPADTVLTLLRNDNLSVDSEEAVFEAISSWVAAGDKECDNERLRLHAPEMLKEVRWCQTTVQFRSRLVDSHPIFHDSISCARFMAQVEQWMIIADKNKPPCPFNRRRRPPQMIFVFGKDKNRDRWSVLRFDSQLEKEERIADMEKREWASYSVVGESIFVVGGNTAQGSHSTSVEEFLVAERRWRKRASLAVGRSYHAAAVLTEAGGETLIGVFGGYNGSRLSSCEVYEVGRDRWFKLPDMQEKRNETAAACLPGDSRIFVFGGYNGSSPLASVEFCHLRADWRERATSSDFWQPAAPMRTARCALAATHFPGKIIVAGGKGGGNVVEMFTPPDARCPQGQWTGLAGMKEPRAFFALLISTDDAIFALGHWWGSGNTVETFTGPGGSADVSNDLTAWSWSLKKPLETLANIAGAASIRM
nr:unnamed protein product [Spirometra erinaceieuropaei]